MADKVIEGVLQDLTTNPIRPLQSSTSRSS